MSYSAQNKKAFFSLVKAGGSHDAWADSFNEFSRYYETNSSGNYNWNSTYYLRPIQSRKIPSLLESHISILSSSTDTNGRWCTTRMNTTTTDKSHMGLYRNFYAWTSVYSDDSIYERSEDAHTINAYDDFSSSTSFFLEKARTSSALFFPLNY